MRKILFLLTMLFTLSCSGCIHAMRHDGEYRGKVFDGETKAPLENVTILGVWYTLYPTPAGEVSSFYDAKETLTDRNGEFSIPGLGLRVMSNLSPMSVMVFKAGYTAVESRTWGSIKTKEELDRPINADMIVNRNSFPYQMKYTMDYLSYMDANGIANFPLRKLTIEERKNYTGPGRVSMPEEKMPLMMKEIDRDRIEQGMKPMFNKWR